MLHIGALGALFGIAQSRRLSFGLLIALSLIAAFWICSMSSMAGHSFLHSVREGVYGAWSAEAGAFVGLLLDRIVLHRE